MTDRHTPSASLPWNASAGGVVWIALATIVHVTLVSAAIETFRAGSPVKWYVVGGVGAYVAAVLAAWRLVPGLAKHAKTSDLPLFGGGLFLALLALTAWLPRGNVDGIRVFGQSTATVLAFVSAASVALAGLSLARMRFVPHWVRFALGALAVYGVLSFAVAIDHGTPYPALFHGQSFWISLPRFLQGAFVGSLVVLPLGCVPYVVRAGLRHAADIGSVHWSLRRAVAASLSLAIAFAGAVPHDMAAQQSAGAAASPRPSSVSLSIEGVEAIRESLDQPQAELTRGLAAVSPSGSTAMEQTQQRARNLFGWLQAARQLVPRDTFDIDAAVAQAGRAPGDLHRWMRDHTTLVGYRGLLRGAQGVLMDRVGNSLDRALLLASMLRATGATVRLARARLSREQAEALGRANGRIPGGSGGPLRPNPPVTENAWIDHYARQAGVNGAALQRHLEDLQRVSLQAASSIQNRVDAQTSKLVQLLGANARMETTGHDDTVTEALRDHWWAQWLDGSTWKDLDPLMSAPGAALVPAEEITDPDHVRDDLKHEVVIRVIIERWDGAHFAEACPLKETLRPSDLIGESVRLQQIAADPPFDVSVIAGADHERRFKAAVVKQREWLPVLTVGARQIHRSSFTDSGDLRDKAASAPDGGGTSQAVGGMLDAFGGGSEPAPGILTAEWIDYEIRSPGETARTVRREVFDLVGPAARSAGRGPATIADDGRWERGLALLGETEILPVACQLSMAFLTDLMAERALANQSTVDNLLEHDTFASREKFNEGAGKLIPVPSALYSLAVARSQAATVAGVYIARPNVFARHTYLRSAPGTGLQLTEAFDIVANDVDVSPSTAAGRFVSRLRQGVLDSNAEVILSTGAERNGTAMLFDDGIASAPWDVVASPRDVEGLGLPPDAQSRIAGDIGAGFLVVVPRASTRNSASPLAWWRIDPRTGGTLGIGNRGWGQAIVERIAVTYVAAAFGAQICYAYAGKDKGGYTKRDRWVCGWTTGGGSTGVLAATFAGPLAVPLTMLAILGVFCAEFTAGGWLSDDPEWDKP
jgi:hypothetical protein